MDNSSIPSRIKNITGRKIGRLMAVKFIKREKGITYWLFKCDCGNEVVKNSHNITSKKVRSCGCLEVERLKKLAKHNTKKNNQGYKNRIYRNYKKAAQYRNYEFNLAKNIFENMLLERCYYCDAEPGNTIQEGMKPAFAYNGIDRKDNTLGYIETNCVPCCYTCNKMKMNMGSKEFIDQICKIYKYLKEREVVRD